MSQTSRDEQFLSGAVFGAMVGALGDDLLGDFLDALLGGRGDALERGLEEDGRGEKGVDWG